MQLKLKMDIIKNFNNALLKRKEIEISFDSESNPGIVKASKDIAETFKVNEEQIVIKRIKSGFGSNNFSVNAFIYENKDLKDSTEPKRKEKKKK